MPLTFYSDFDYRMYRIKKRCKIDRTCTRSQVTVRVIEVNTKFV